MENNPASGPTVWNLELLIQWAKYILNQSVQLSRKHKAFVKKKKTHKKEEIGVVKIILENEM